MRSLFFLYGFYGLLAQFFLLRELALVFLGHEITVSLALTAWLFWTGLGSFSRRGACASPSSAAVAAAALGLAAPLTVLAVRLLKLLTPSGSLPGPLESFAVPLAAVGPTAWLSGAAFALFAACAPAGEVYFLESLGALAGGLAGTFIFAGRIPALAALSMLGALLALLAGVRGKSGWAVILGLACLGLAAFSAPLDRATRALQWRGYELVAQKEGRYGHLAVAGAGELRILFENGLVSAHFPDPSAREEAVHWPLLAHPDPRRVLVLGLGGLPSLGEILKHPVETVTVVEPDSEAVELLRGQLDPEAFRALADPRVGLITADPREWVRARARAYDAILQFSADPINASANRLYTREFFAQARRCLRSGGILAFTIPSSADYLAPETAYTDASVWNALSAFGHKTLVPGDRMLVLASDAPINIEAAALASVYRGRGLRTQTLAPANFEALLAPERREGFLNILAPLEGVPANEDLKPAAYLLAWKIWLSKFSSPIGLLLLLVASVGAAWQARRLPSVWKAVSAENAGLFCLGFSAMGLEVILLLAFQAASGALYWRLGALFACFMAGLALGSGLAPRGVPRPRTLGLLLAGLAAGEVGLAAALHFLSSLGSDAAMAVFGGLLAADGFCVGLAYPLACGRDAAGAYSADLWGSAAGGLAAVLLIPSTGLRPALALCAAALLPACLRLLRSR